MYWETSSKGAQALTRHGQEVRSDGFDGAAVSKAASDPRSVFVFLPPTFLLSAVLICQLSMVSLSSATNRLWHLGSDMKPWARLVITL